MKHFRFLLAALFALTLSPAIPADAFVHHHMVGLRGPTGGGGGWANTYSCKYAGTATATAGRTNFGQPSPWCVDYSANPFTVSFWFKRNGDDGSLLASADQSTNNHFRVGVGGTALANMYAGGQYVYTSCSTTITDNTWYLATFAFDGAGGLKVYVGNSSTSCIGAFTGISTDVCTRDWIINTLRSSTNADTAFGEWGLHNMDEITMWDVELSGTDHTALIDGSGHAVDPTTHTQAANLVSYIRCGDDASDTSGTVIDTIGGYNGTHSGSDGVTYQAAVP